MTFFQQIALLPIRFYRRFISPLKPQPTCRFHPSCSSYAFDAIKIHGVIYGTYLSTKRVLKCHPFHPGGFDPVPTKKSNHNQDHKASAKRMSEEF